MDRMGSSALAEGGYLRPATAKCRVALALALAALSLCFLASLSACNGSEETAPTERSDGSQGGRGGDPQGTVVAMPTPGSSPKPVPAGWQTYYNTTYVSFEFS